LANWFGVSEEWVCKFGVSEEWVCKSVGKMYGTAEGATET